MKFKREKYIDLLMYILFKTGHKPNFGKTVLCTILYFIDFSHYEAYGELMTNETYIKSRRGIRPTHFREIAQYLIDTRQLFFKKVPYYNRTLHKYYPLVIPDVRFSQKELAIIDYWIAKLSDNNAHSITIYAIRDPPITVADFGEEIDCRHVLSRNQTPLLINSFI